MWQQQNQHWQGQNSAMWKQQYKWLIHDNMLWINTSPQEIIVSHFL